MQIKLDKLGITVEFVAGQTYELEFDIPSDSMLFGVEMNGRWLFDGENFKPQFTTDAITINSRAIKDLCVAIDIYNKNNCYALVKFCNSHGSNCKTHPLSGLGCFLTIVGHKKPTTDNTDEQEIKNDEEFAREFFKAWDDVFGSLIFKKSGLLNDTTDNTDEQEINKLAKEMKRTIIELPTTMTHSHAWQELARKMYYPKKALDEALASEREYFGLLRQIGQHLGVNVGTDVGVTELPDLVKDLLIKNAQLKNEVELHKQYSKSAALQHTDMDKKLTMATELVDDLSDICRKLLKTSYAHTGVQGVHPGQAELFKALGKKLGVDLPYA